MRDDATHTAPVERTVPNGKRTRWPAIAHYSAVVSLGRRTASIASRKALGMR
jgi:hypothetical protein